MKESKFIISAFSDEAGAEFTTQLAALTRNSIPGMEIRGVDGENISALSHAKVREIKAELDARGISVFNIGSPVGKIGIDDPFEPHLDQFKHLLESAHILGSQRMRIFSFYVSDEERVARRDDVMERLARFVDAARGSGVLLCHENERGIYGEGPAQCVDIARSISDIRLVFDPANFVLNGVAVRPAWEEMAQYTEYLHIKDAICEGSRIVPPGEGEGDLTYLLSRYAARGGKHITLEPHLFQFVGLSGLEHKDSDLQVGGMYETQEESFDAAVCALRKVIDQAEE